MHDGTVKSFNKNKGFGFIEFKEAPTSIFVTINTVKNAGFDTLIEGQRVQFEIMYLRGGKTEAINLVVLDKDLEVKSTRDILSKYESKSNNEYRGL
jgi:CspA family cold shock protein